jgi:pyruvate formate lyase activating enzyme
MKIASVQKTTLIDYPGEIASTIFLRGCNYNCSFCYNKSLIPFDGDEFDMSSDECFDILISRKDKIDHVVITGGEPTCSSGILEFLDRLKVSGFKVKLDTNGSNPEILRKIIDSGLVEYVAMDVKSSPSRYFDIVGIFGQGDKVLSSMEILKLSGIDYEFRTTVFKEFFTIEHFEEIFKFIGPYYNKYYLQNFFNATDEAGFTAFSKKEIDEVVKVAEKYGIKVGLRGVWL